MSPFSPDVRDEIREQGNWTCYSCGKSMHDPEMWLMDAMHNEHQNDEKGGKCGCRICHLLHDLDMGDIHAVGRIANRIWNTGLRHLSQYEKNPGLFTNDRVQFSEMLTALGLSGRIHIEEKVHCVEELRPYVAKQMMKVKRH